MKIMVIILIKKLNYTPCNIIFLAVSMYKERNKKNSRFVPAKKAAEHSINGNALNK